MTIAGAQPCSTSRSRSWRPPGQATRCTTAASTTRSTASSSGPGRFSVPASRCGSRGYYGKRRPLRRAARYEGFFPLGLDHPEQLAEIAADLAALRREAARPSTQPYDVVVALPPGDDPAPYAAAGATWWLVEFPWDAVSVDQVRAVTRDGPALLRTE